MCPILFSLVVLAWSQQQEYINKVKVFERIVTIIIISQHIVYHQRRRKKHNKIAAIVWNPDVMMAAVGWRFDMLFSLWDNFYKITTSCLFLFIVVKVNKLDLAEYKNIFVEIVFRNLHFWKPPVPQKIVFIAWDNTINSVQVYSIFVTR